MQKHLTVKSFFAKKYIIAVIGLGYVGLPLAAHLSRNFKVIGYDNNEVNITELKNGHDRTLELTDAELKKPEIHFTSDAAELSDCRLFIVAVPTPVDDSHVPDLRAI
jgi:UDP-N-acetyl-D-galactosamine dehydrogenase